MARLHIDIETYSNVDIKKAGLYKYVESPDFEVLLFAYSFDGGPVEILDFTKGEQLPWAVHEALFDAHVTKHAYNAAFEWYCLQSYFNMTGPARTDWLRQWRCTQLHGLYCGYTAGLAVTGEVLGLDNDKKKMSTGTSLIRTFCTPCKPTKANGGRTRTLPHHEPGKWELFKDYCKQDVVTEMEVERRLTAFPVPDAEQRLWELDQEINARGVKVDTTLIKNALIFDERATAALIFEAVALSGLQNPNSLQQLIAWLRDAIGKEIPNLQKDTVKGLLKSDLLSDAARRMLEIRQELGKTSVSKYTAMDTAVCKDARIRGLFQFYSANRTGRWGGRIVQPQNLPRNSLATLDLARRYVRDGDMDAVKLLYGNVPDTLSQLIRTAFVPEDGKQFLVADFSAIEARVIAWMAGETWRQQVFATHGKIYEASASAMFGIPVEKIKKGNPEYELRQRGKIAELALGYQGGPRALISQGALEKGLTEEELPDIVRRWREANKRIVELWYAVENTALSVVRTGRPAGIRGLLFSLEGGTHQTFLTIRLPGGRKLYYARPFLAPNRWGNDSIHYYERDQKTGKWGVSDTYGGKLVENCVQAIARDCLAQSMQRLAEAGYQIVMHVHDEVVIESENPAELETICAMMGQPIPWAPGLLLRAEGFCCEFYKKE